MRLKVRDLSPAAIYAQPISYDWDEHDGEWRVICPQVEEAQGCGKSDFGPMMNYYYPLPAVQAPQLLADALYRKNLPVALLYFPHARSYALALTGGGMDLSWEICFGYVLAGYLPPFHFCDLPQYAVRPTGWRRLVLGACRRTCRIVKKRADSTGRRLKSERFFAAKAG